MSDIYLQKTVTAFNNRMFSQAVEHSEQGLNESFGRDEAFWLGIHEMCNGFAQVMDGNMVGAEKILVAAMQKLRNFGYRFNNFDVTCALAAIRLAVQEIRVVRQGYKRAFDTSLLPQLRMAAKADL